MKKKYARRIESVNECNREDQLLAQTFQPYSDVITKNLTLSIITLFYYWWLTSLLLSRMHTGVLHA